MFPFDSLFQIFVGGRYQADIHGYFLCRTDRTYFFSLAGRGVVVSAPRS